MSIEKLVLGRYRVLERVGRGAMGVIYRGLDPVLDREVAIKVMSADFAAEGEESKRRFFREARAAAKLQHRNIVTVFEFAEEDGVPYIVMEFLRGQSLAARIADGPVLQLEQKLDIIAELCNGLQYASESGVIHRDVKPANIWLLEDGSVKLVDFGIAKITTATSTIGKDVIGSAAYMSPEQAEGKVVDGRTDIFSAAVVLYEIVAGRRPFEASTPTATLLKIVQDPPPPIADVVPDVPPLLVATIERALEKNPADRYQTAAVFGTELRGIRALLQANSEIGLATVSTLGASTTTRATAHSAEATTATPTARRPGRSGHPRWERLLLAGAIGGLVMTAVLYWIQVGWGTARQAPPVDPGEQTATPGPAVNPANASVAPAQSPTSPATTPAAKTAPKTIRLRATADYDFAIFADKERTRRLSDFRKIHADVEVPDGTKQVWLYAPEKLLSDARPVDRERLTVSVPGLGQIVFQDRADCQPIHYLRRDIPPLARIDAAEGSRAFDFDCDDAPAVGRRLVEVKAGTLSRVPLK